MCSAAISRVTFLPVRLNSHVLLTNWLLKARAALYVGVNRSV